MRIVALVLLSTVACGSSTRPNAGTGAGGVVLTGTGGTAGVGTTGTGGSATVIPPPTLIATGWDIPTRIVLAGGNVYWRTTPVLTGRPDDTQTPVLWRASKSGGAAQVISGPVTFSNNQVVAATRTNVYWLQAQGGSKGGSDSGSILILQDPLDDVTSTADGGVTEASVFVDYSTAAATKGVSRILGGIAVTDEYMYINALGADEINGPIKCVLIRAPLTDGTALVKLGEIPYPATSSSSAMVIDEDSAYWWLHLESGSPTRSIMKWPLAGGPPVEVASGIPNSNSVSDIAVDSQNVYWTTGAYMTIMAAPKTGGTPVMLYKGGEPTELALYGDDIYYVDHGTGKPAIAKIPKTGGSPTYLIPKAFAGGVQVVAIAVDETGVYFGNAGGAIYRTDL